MAMVNKSIYVIKSNFIGKIKMKTILKEGNGHKKFLFSGKHKWLLVDYHDPIYKKLEKEGHKDKILDSYYANYVFVYRCECGAEMFIEEVAFI
jgi:hypothetical protein